MLVVALKPQISVEVQPRVGGSVRYLRSAPNAGGADEGLMNLALYITNTSSKAIHIVGVSVKVLSSSTAQQDMAVSWTFQPEGSVNANGAATDRGWCPLPQSHVFSIPTGTLSVRVAITSSTASQPLELVLSLERAASPGGAYRFWSDVRDMRPGEFWAVSGLGHSHDNPAQVHAYDVGVTGGNPLSPLLPGGDQHRNEDYRIFGKPIYAVADGVVQACRSNFPNNADAKNPLSQTVLDRIESIGDGNGNFFMIATDGGDESVLYAHMQKGSLNPDLAAAGRHVKAGDFLGLAGNSGSSTNPHMHIHSNRRNTGPLFWVDAPRPLTWVHARAVARNQLGQANPPWVPLAGRGVPTGESAIWPSDNPVVTTRAAAVSQFAISSTRQVWVVRKPDGAVRLSSQALPARGFVGVWLDQNPGGNAKAIAVRGSQVWVIGSDDAVWEGRVDHWERLPGSPSAKRLAVDAESGQLWCLTTGGAVKSYSSSTHTWSAHPGNAVAQDLCVYQGRPFICHANGAMMKSDGANGWAPFAGGGSGKRLTVDADTGKFWAVGTNDGIWSYQGASGWDEHPGGGRAREICVSDGQPFVIGITGDGLWQSAGEHGWRAMNVIEPA